jgi:hypothetical protein
MSKNGAPALLDILPQANDDLQRQKQQNIRQVPIPVNCVDFERAKAAVLREFPNSWHLVSCVSHLRLFSPPFLVEVVKHQPRDKRAILDHSVQAQLVGVLRNHIAQPDRRLPPPHGTMTASGSSKPASLTWSWNSAAAVACPKMMLKSSAGGMKVIPFSLLLLNASCEHNSDLYVNPLDFGGDLDIHSVSHAP